MAEEVDLLVHSAAQVCVVPSPGGGPQRGEALGETGIVEDGAVALRSGRVVAVGPTAALRADYDAGRTLDVGGKVVTPGFVDPHTHVVWAGDRAAEFEMRVAGASYMDIMSAGGGINSTVRQTREASVDELVAQTRPRLERMLAYGTTTVEAKTGYGLDTQNEIKMLEALLKLDAELPIDIVPTFLGAHAVPPEFEGRTDDYVDLVVEEMTPGVGAWAREKDVPRLFCDVFCEEGVFDVAQSRRILEAGREAGMALKIHADEFVGLGGTALAVELGAASADHLVATPEEDIAALGQGETVAVGLPGTPFGLGEEAYTPAGAILKAGGALAIATDCNPGTGWCESMQFVMALAARYMQLTPAQALVAATLNAAHAVGLGDEVGSLEVGRRADVLVLDIPDYRHLGYRFGTNLVQTVIKNGQIVLGAG